MGNCCGHHGNSPVTRRRDPDSPTKLAKATYCACRPRTASCVLGCIMASLCALVWSMRPLYWCRAVTIDEVNALKELYKHVSNSLHKVRTAAACPSCRLFRSQGRGSALCRKRTRFVWPRVQDGVIQKDEFMQALFHTQPGQPNLFANRVRPLQSCPRCRVH